MFTFFKLQSMWNAYHIFHVLLSIVFHLHSGARWNELSNLAPAAAKLFLCKHKAEPFTE